MKANRRSITATFIVGFLLGFNICYVMFDQGILRFEKTETLVDREIKKTLRIRPATKEEMEESKKVESETRSQENK